MLLVFNQFQAMVSFYSCWKQQKTKGLSASVLIPKIKSFQPSNNCSSYFQSKILWQPCCTEHIKYNAPLNEPNILLPNVSTLCTYTLKYYENIMKRFFLVSNDVFWNFNPASKLKCHVAIMLMILICIA